MSGDQENRQGSERLLTGEETGSASPFVEGETVLFGVAALIFLGAIVLNNLDNVNENSAPLPAGHVTKPLSPSP